MKRGYSADRFSGQIAAITGAGSGIGASTAQRLAAEGAAVALLDRDLEAVESLARDLRQQGRSAECVELDQADERSVERAFADTAFDIVVVSAGVAYPEAPIDALTVSQWDDLHATNLRGPFLVARGAVHALRRAGGGALVFVASTSALGAHPGAGPYAASKAGVLGLARSLAVELAPEGIRVNSVCPGAVETAMLQRVYGSRARAVSAEAAAGTPSGRIARPDDVAAAIAFLGSEDAVQVIGAELVVDGGSLIKL